MLMASQSIAFSFLLKIINYVHKFECCLGEKCDQHKVGTLDACQENNNIYTTK